VAEEHLAGDFGVDGVGVVEQWGSDEGEAGIEEEPEGDEDEAVALDGGLGGREKGFHRWREYDSSYPRFLEMQCH